MTKQDSEKVKVMSEQEEMKCEECYWHCIDIIDGELDDWCAIRNGLHADCEYFKPEEVGQ